ncbi:MAG: hypothetical protein R2758_11345 [Bacteroidales bacterium]
MKEVRDNLITDLTRKHMNVEMAIEPGTTVNANRSLIVSIFQNLL